MNPADKRVFLVRVMLSKRGAICISRSDSPGVFSSDRCHKLRLVLHCKSLLQSVLLLLVGVAVEESFAVALVGTGHVGRRVRLNVTVRFAAKKMLLVLALLEQSIHLIRTFLCW